MDDSFPGDLVEWERRYTPKGRSGAVRILGFANHEDAGTYREAPRVNGIPDLGPTRRNGTLKYGIARLRRKAAERVEQAARRDRSLSPAEDAEILALLEEAQKLEIRDKQGKKAHNPGN